MNKDSVPEADGTKSVRLEETFPGWKAETRGAEPRPVRKRGFWRAFRRKELGAVVPYSLNLATKKIIQDLCAELYSDVHCPNDQIYIMWPLSKIVGVSE